jgi:hypothetical protein
MYQGNGRYVHTYVQKTHGDRGNMQEYEPENGRYVQMHAQKTHGVEGKQERGGKRDRRREKD